LRPTATCTRSSPTRARASAAAGRRLERAQRDLGDPARAHWTIAEIARHHGLRDPSYFARAFRTRYGIAPRRFPQALAAAGLGEA
jgi:AraC-like DNA-binding protein